METRMFSGKWTTVVAVLLAVAALSTSLDCPTLGATTEQVKVGEYTLSGPYAHENLTIFLIHGPDQVKNQNFLTLQEALEQKKIIVHEIKSVNQLAIENVSTDAEVFIQSGDIVKGGQQDRVLAYDLIVPPLSGKIPIAAYCVEAGRWQQRGQEKAVQFESSISQLPTKELKLATKVQAAQHASTLHAGNRPSQQAQAAEPAQTINQASQRAGRAQAGRRVPQGQGAVWMEVDVVQKKLQRNLKTEVRANQSQTSLQLTLENKKVQEEAARYVAKLAPIIDNQNDAIGYVFAINGKVNSADVYSSSALFKKLWPKLVKDSGIEALIAFDPAIKSSPVGAEAIKAFLLDSAKGKASREAVTKRIELKVQETDKSIFFESHDREHKGAWIHRNYLAY